MAQIQQPNVNKMFELVNKNIRERKQQNPSDEQQYEKMVGYS